MASRGKGMGRTLKRTKDWKGEAPSSLLKNYCLVFSFSAAGCTGDLGFAA